MNQASTFSNSINLALPSEILLAILRLVHAEHQHNPFHYITNRALPLRKFMNLSLVSRLWYPIVQSLTFSSLILHSPAHADRLLTKINQPFQPVELIRELMFQVARTPKDMWNFMEEIVRLCPKLDYLSFISLVDSGYNNYRPLPLLPHLRFLKIMPGEEAAELGILDMVPHLRFMGQLRHLEIYAFEREILVPNSRTTPPKESKIQLRLKSIRLRPLRRTFPCLLSLFDDSRNTLTSLDIRSPRHGGISQAFVCQFQFTLKHLVISVQGRTDHLFPIYLSDFHNLRRLLLFYDCHEMYGILDAVPDLANVTSLEHLSISGFSISRSGHPANETPFPSRLSLRCLDIRLSSQNNHEEREIETNIVSFHHLFGSSTSSLRCLGITTTNDNPRFLDSGFAFSSGPFPNLVALNIESLDPLPFGLSQGVNTQLKALMLRTVTKATLLPDSIQHLYLRPLTPEGIRDVAYATVLALENQNLPNLSDITLFFTGTAHLPSAPLTTLREICLKKGIKYRDGNDNLGWNNKTIWWERWTDSFVRPEWPTSGRTSFF